MFKKLLLLVAVSMSTLFSMQAPKIMKLEEALQFNGEKLVYCAVGSFHPAGWDPVGYLQSFPMFLENFLKNKESKGKVKIILIDPAWGGSGPTFGDYKGYQDSSLAYHINEQKLDISSNICLVDSAINIEEKFKELEDYFSEVVDNGGALWLVRAYAGAHGLSDLYNVLRKKEIVQKYPYQVQLLSFDFGAGLMIPQDKDYKGGTLPAVWWGKNRYNHTDADILEQRSRQLGIWLNKDFPTQMLSFKEDWKRLDPSDQEKALVCGDLIIRYPIADFIPRSTIIMNGDEQGLKSMFRENLGRHIIDVNDYIAEKIDCTLVALTHAKNFPLLDYYSINKQNDTYVVTPIITVEAGQFNYLDTRFHLRLPYFSDKMEKMLECYRKGKSGAEILQAEEIKRREALRGMFKKSTPSATFVVDQLIKKANESSGKKSVPVSTYRSVSNWVSSWFY